MQGIIALSGVVVHASLVMAHTLNGFRSEGFELGDSVRKAPVLRFRPIALTTASRSLLDEIPGLGKTPSSKPGRSRLERTHLTSAHFRVAP